MYPRTSHMIIHDDLEEIGVVAQFTEILPGPVEGVINALE